jgi:GST-like protein
MLGNSLTALDLYVSMMSWWHPGRNWLSQECPKIYASIQHTDQHPVVASVLRRNYSMGG